MKYLDPTGHAVPILILIGLAALLYGAIGSILWPYKNPGESYLACVGRFMKPLLDFVEWARHVAALLIASFAVRAVMLMYFLFLVVDDMMAEMIAGGALTPTLTLIWTRLGEFAMVALVKPVYYVVAFATGWFLVGAIRCSMPVPQG